MRYQVPQFIEIEDKIFGPFTFKQFIYIAGGVGLAFIFYRFLPFILAIPFMLAAVAFGFALAMYKVNNKPFIEVLEAGVKYFLGSKLYLWKKTVKKPEANTQQSGLGESANIAVPKLSESKLKDLSWSLDINETAYSKEVAPTPLTTNRL